MDNFIMEDYEYDPERDQIYLEEYRRVYEAEYWEWYEKSEGRVFIENPDGTKTEIDETINDYKLPF